MDPDDIQMNSVTSSLDEIPIMGHIKALIYITRGQTDLAVKAFSAATHRTGVICFGVLGGYLASKAGSILGGVIGGFLVDIPISLITTTRYEYVDYLIKWWSRDMVATDLNRLLESINKDAVTGLFASIACNNYNIPMVLWNNLKQLREIDFNTLMAETDRVSDMGFVFENKSKKDDLQYIWVHGIPIIGHVASLICQNEDNMDANKSFRDVTHKTVVMYFGVLGAHCADCVGGSIAGGIIGGVLVDAIISKLTSSGYGYFSHSHWRIDDLINLRMLVSKDGITGLLGYTVFEKLCRVGLVEETRKDLPGVICVLKIKKEMCGENSMCVRKPYEDADYREFKDSAILFFGAMNVGLALASLRLKNLPHFIRVENIHQIESGDHIVYEREFMGFNVYDHHAIVDQVFRMLKKYTVIEQAPFNNRNELMFHGKAWIQHTEKCFEEGRIYKVDHGEAASTRYIVRKTAVHILENNINQKAFNKKYNVMFNNCEHFANFCATNVFESQQVQGTTELVLPFVVSGVIIATGYLSPVIVCMSRIVDSFDFKTLTDITFP